VDEKKALNKTVATVAAFMAVGITYVSRKTVYFLLGLTDQTYVDVAIEKILKVKYDRVLK